MTVLTSHDTLVVEGLVHHFCGLIWLPSEPDLRLPRCGPLMRSESRDGP
jgi:hypothetical protein